MNNAEVAGMIVAAAKNPLIPEMYDIVWSAVVFLIILVVFWIKILPKFTEMLDQRAAAIEGNIAKADEAQAKAEEMLQEYNAQLAGARQEAGEIREAARQDATKIVAKAKEQATTEQDRIVSTAKAQIEGERQSALVSLRKEVGSLAVDLASGVVSENLSDDQKAAAYVDKFLNELATSEKAAK